MKKHYMLLQVWKAFIHTIILAVCYFCRSLVNIFLGQCYTEKGIKNTVKTNATNVKNKIKSK